MLELIPYLIGAIALGGAVWYIHGHLAEIKAKIDGKAAAPAPVTVTVHAGNTAPVTAPPIPTPVQQGLPAILPAGVTWADEANGLVFIAALEQYHPGRKYAVKQAEDFVPPGSSTFYALVQNIQNSTFGYAHDMPLTGVFHPVKPNGLTNGYSLDTSVDISGVFTCPDTYPTFDSVVTWLTANALAQGSLGPGGNFVPHK